MDIAAIMACNSAVNIVELSCSLYFIVFCALNAAHPVESSNLEQSVYMWTESL